MSITSVNFSLRPIVFALPRYERSPTMATPTCVKVPGESRLYSFNFGDYPELQQGQTLSGTPSVASDVSGPIFGSPFLAGNVVLCQISGGTDGIDYNLTVTSGTSGGFTIQGVAKLQVRALP